MNAAPYLEYGALGLAIFLALIVLYRERDSAKERKEMRQELQAVITNFSLVMQNHMEHQMEADIERTEAQVKQTAAMERLTDKIGALCEMWSLNGKGR